MGIWGKIIGGAAGFLMGGPAGAIMGASLGHAADSGAIRGGGMPRPADLAALLGNKETLFAVAVVVLSAKLAKVDGAVKREEIAAFRAQFRIPEENLREVGRLFDQARENATGFEPFADRLGQAFADNPALLEDVLHALFAVARADGPVNRGEIGFLGIVHTRFRLPVDAWDRALGGTPHRAPREVDAVDAYAVLGVAKDAPDEAIRAAWRKLMRDHHPDSMAARGVPEAFAKRATDKVAEINAAWDRIKRARGL
ncbi:TerB family tellurite resistance protein [Humitalea sp. 24SJ18S-53]|uniref:TerB family tellurite resistance protein n=1 Tax=Humitalea sp. 24SJ18S-53 TaxID=3422307 RepID=UPI003D66CD39